MNKMKRGRINKKENKIWEMGRKLVLELSSLLKAAADPQNQCDVLELKPELHYDSEWDFNRLVREFKYNELTVLQGGAVRKVLG